MRHPVTKRRLNRPPTNAESIQEIPGTHITDTYRAELLERANAGEDVYAYGSIDSPTGIINVWDWDTRIPLFPLAQWRWELQSQRYDSESGQWLLTFKRHGFEETQQIAVWITRDSLGAADLKVYINRAKRRGVMIANYLNLYGYDPDHYHNLHF
jgi:hypothetical protein